MAGTTVSSGLTRESESHRDNRVRHSNRLGASIMDKGVYPSLPGKRNRKLPERVRARVALETKKTFDSQMPDGGGSVNVTFGANKTRLLITKKEKRRGSGESKEGRVKPQRWSTHTHTRSSIVTIVSG